ncbi:MAG TPA: 2-oxo-4-hydroxy-4-carboxy-5-ureidoimidazoline decarboxylase [Stellaceae bacterium]|nr:2-oxo-4-hydroxy-4-carboxy-5-ureidoimidazoline decarboxylase [Stellaceae bacterium]
MIDLAGLNALDRPAFVALLANVYEHARWAAEVAEAARPFASFAALQGAFARAVALAPAEQQLELIGAHPELADRLARGALTEHSRGEQKGAGLDSLSDAEFAQLTELNRAYRDRFAFPFIICVRRHTKDSILKAFRVRLAHDRDQERATALAETDRIAALRLADIVDDPATAALNGVLSTHVLDTHAGKPAVGVAITLHELCLAGPPRLLAQRVTNLQGRTDTPLIAGRPLPQGRYELSFAIGDYFAARGVISGEQSYLDHVPVRFAIADAEAHYHIPLLVTPWSYSTYRGS